MIEMDKGQGKMQNENEFQLVLQKYEDMLKARISYFFDVEEFEEIIDYYLDLNDFGHASEAAEKGLIQHPGSYDIRIKLIHILLESGNAESALGNLEDFADYEKNDADYYLLKGTALVSLSKFKEAEKIFDLALDKSLEDSAEIYINISIAFENARQYNLALKYLKKADEVEPNNLSVLYDLGYYYERIQNFEKSIRYYNKYLDVDSYSENVWHNLGVIYTKINNLAKAHDCYDYAIAINPSYGLAYFNKAHIFADDENYQEAIRIYEDFLKIDPSNLQAWNFLGECYEELEDHKEALKIYKHIIKLDNTYSDGWYGAGLAYMQMEKLSEARTYILKAIDFDRENTEYWYSLGEIYSIESLYTESVKCFNQVCKLDPQDREAWIRLAFLHIEEDNLSDANRVLKDAYRHNKSSQDILYMISALSFRLQDMKLGMSFFEKAHEQGEGGLKVFYKVYPEGEKLKIITDFLNSKSNKK